MEQQKELTIKVSMDREGNLRIASVPEKATEKQKQMSPDVPFKTRSYGPKETIYREGDHAASIMFVDSGTVKTFVRGERKEQIAAHVYRKDDLFGEIALTKNVRYDTATAMEETEIREYSVADIRRAISGNVTATSLIDRLCDRVEYLYGERSGGAAVHSMNRLIAELLDIGKRDGVPAEDDKVFVDTKYTHELLAARIDTRRETVTLHMQFLSSRGAAVKQNGGLLLDMDLLHKLLSAKERSKKKGK